MANTKLKPLHEILRYKNPEVVSLFKRSHPVYSDLADSVFQELLKFLWVSANHYYDNKPNIPESIFISPELFLIDEMWHSFLLFSESYKSFCMGHFGIYLNHIPLKENERNQQSELQSRDPELALKTRQAQIKPVLEYLYDHLGAETVKYWYQDLYKIQKSRETSHSFV